MADKVKFGIKNVHIAPMTDTTAETYGTVIAIPGAVSLSLEAQGDTSDFYADNTKYFVSVANNGYSGDLEIANIPEEVLTAIFKFEEDTKKVLVENSKYEPVPFAMMWEQDGDVTGTKFCLYNCKATRPSREFNTTTESKEVQTMTLSVVASPLKNGQTIAMTTADTDSTVVSDWYTAPYVVTP